MDRLSIVKLAALMNGRVAARSGRNLIQIGGCRFGVVHPTSLTFLTNPYKSELGLLNFLKRNNVHCLVVTYPTILSIKRFRKSGIAIIKVKNLKYAYQALARFYNKQFSIPHVQVTGSSGKTTTKNMIGAVLKENFHTLTTVGNLNSPTGVAKSLFRLKPNHQAAVLEAGMKARGVISMSSRLIRPDIGVIASINSSHLARMGSIRNIIAAKAEMLRFIPKKGFLIVNWDDENCRKLPLRRCKGKIIRYGFSEQCDVWASNIQQHDFTTTFMVHAGELLFSCSINIIGKYNVGNALAAVAVGLKMGMESQEIARGLKRFKPTDGRLKVYRRKDGAVIIDDNFNANPDSTRLLVDELIIMAREQPVALVIGDMERPSRNIKRYARRVHYNIGQQIAKGEFSHVLAVGLWAKQYYRGAINAGFPREKLSYRRTVHSARAKLRKLLKPGTVVVLKASTYTPLGRLRTKAFKSSN